MIAKIYLSIIFLSLSITQAKSHTESDVINERYQASCRASALSSQLRAFQLETHEESNRIYETTVRPRLDILDARRTTLKEEWPTWKSGYKASLVEKYQKFKAEIEGLTDKKDKSKNFLDAVYNLYNLYSEWDEYPGDLDAIDAYADREDRWVTIIEGAEKDTTFPKSIFAAYSEFGAERERYRQKKKEIEAAQVALSAEEEVAHAEYNAYLHAKSLEEAAIMAEMVRLQRQSEAALDRLKTEFGFGDGG